MRNTLVSILLAGLFGGIVGAAAHHFLASDGSASSTDESSTAVGPAGESVLLDRLTALEARERALSQEIALWRSAPAPSPRAPAEGQYASLADLESLRNRLDAELAARKATPVRQEEFRDQVEDALTTIRKQESVTAMRGYQEKRRARLDTDVGTISSKLRLSSHQADQMRAALDAQYVREDEQLRLWEEGVPKEEIGARKQADGEQFARDVGQFLDKDQLEQFWTIISGKYGPASSK